MKFAKVGDVMVAFEPTNFKAKYKTCFDNGNTSIHDQWLAYFFNNFDNDLARANEALFKKMGYWIAISRDKVIDSTGTDSNGRLNIVYVSHAGLPNQKEHKVAAPTNGWYVPTKDGTFVPETGVPFETVSSKDMAIKKLEAAGMPKEQVSYWYRLDNYRNNERFVGHDFGPNRGGFGQFGVDAYRFPGRLGLGRVGSLPAHVENQIVFEVPIIGRTA